jgi:hypothetical protein
MIVKIFLSTVVISLQLCLLHAANKSNKGLDDLNDIGAALPAVAPAVVVEEEGVCF